MKIQFIKSKLGKIATLNGPSHIIQRMTLIFILSALILSACSTFAQAGTHPPESVVDSSTCLPSSGSEISFVNEEHGYCLLHPAGFTVSRAEPSVVVIKGPNYSEGPEPLTGFVNIRASGPANGRSAAQISDELVAEFQDMENIVIERVDAMLGGERAVEVIGMPGQSLSWHVVAIHNDLVYHLVYSPLGEENGQAFSDMQQLYDIVMRSFTFSD